MGFTSFTSSRHSNKLTYSSLLLLKSPRITSRSMSDSGEKVSFATEPKPQGKGDFHQNT